MECILVRKAQLAKVVAIRAWLDPEKDSDGMTCAASGEGWETNSVGLLSGKIAENDTKNCTDPQRYLATYAAVACK